MIYLRRKIGAKSFIILIMMIATYALVKGRNPFLYLKSETTIDLDSQDALAQIQPGGLKQVLPEKTRDKIVETHKPTTETPVSTTMSLSHRMGLGSYNKSIVFLKGFKVGGSTLATMLVSHAFNKNKIIGNIDGYCRGRLRLAMRRRKSYCIDVIGTDHYREPTCTYPRIESESLCKKAEVFMMVRHPIERLWSGYKHELRETFGQSLTISQFLAPDSNYKVKTPTHMILHRDPQKAIIRSKEINVLLHKYYDESLVFMAVKAGLKLCDIMYVPCEKSNWSSSKCSTDKLLEMSELDQHELEKMANSSGEMTFYNQVSLEAEKKILTPEIKHLTKEYRKLREDVLLRCLQPGVIDRVSELMRFNPDVRQDRRDQQLFHFQTEVTTPLDPLFVCMMWQCGNK